MDAFFEFMWMTCIGLFFSFLVMLIWVNLFEGDDDDDD